MQQKKKQTTQETPENGGESEVYVKESEGEKEETSVGEGESDFYR